MDKFLLLGSPHKKAESISPKLKRIRTGRYGTGRLSFLTSFESLRIRTRRGSFHKSLTIDSDVLDKLYTGNAKLTESRDSPLKRDGTELVMTGAKSGVDLPKISKEIRRLAILRAPMFEVSVKSADRFKEWSFDGAEVIRAPEIQGHRIPLNLDGGRIVGEIIVARRPLTEEERGIAVMVGSHIVTRSNFGFDAKLNRVTGFVRCDSLTTRFADKSAIIEDDEYARFNQAMKSFVIETVIPNMTEYEDVLITREESKIYREIDKVLGQALVETLETQEEVQGYEMVDVKEVVRRDDKHEEKSKKSSSRRHAESLPQARKFDELVPLITEGPADKGSVGSGELAEGEDVVEVVDETQADGTIVRTRKVRRPIMKKTFALKRIGYKVIPYEDETDSRYSFIAENIVFVNKANPTYRAESTRGDEFLLRHVISMVAEAVAQSKHPEGKEALELQNRLVAEAIRIHDHTVQKR
jgi:hypothetical protein